MAKLVNQHSSEAFWVIEDSDVAGMIDQISASEVKVLQIDYQAKIEDLNFLKDIQGLRGLSVFSHGLVDFSGVSACCSIEELTFDVAKIKNFSLNGLIKLKKLRFTWCPGVTLPSEAMPNLEVLTVSRFKFEGLRFLCIFPNLRQLWISESKALTCIDGIDYFEKLEALCISYCPNLTRLRGVAELKCLRELELTGLKRLDSLGDDLAGLCLEKLIVESVLPMASLRPIVLMKSLKLLTLINATIVDGDLGVVIDLPSLNHCWIRPNKPHYRPSASHIAGLVKERRTEV